MDVYSRFFPEPDITDVKAAKPSESHKNEKSVQVGYSKKNVLLVQNIILNARNLLKTYMIEGISLHQFLGAYNVKFSTVLEYEIVKCGYFDLKEFLLSIASRVPLKISSKDGVEIVRFNVTKKQINRLLPWNKPPDIASPEDKFQRRFLPSDFDFIQEVPIYIADFGYPDHIYIHPEIGDWCSNMYYELQSKIQYFYSGVIGEAYRMKPSDIKENVACVYYDPLLDYYHRVIIEKLTSVDTVQIYYVDYGLTRIRSVDDLRYIRKIYMEVPALAMRACLANLKPAKTEDQDDVSWNPAILQKMDNWCNYIRLNAKLMIIKDGILSVISAYKPALGGNEYLHELLINEKLAEMVLPTDVKDINSECCKEMVEETMTTSSLKNSSKINYIPTNDTQPKRLSLLKNSSPVNFQNMEERHPVIQLVPTSPPPLSNSTNMCPTSVVENSPEISFSDLSSLNDMYESVDNEDYFAKICREIGFPFKKTMKKNSLKRITTTDGYAFHLLLYDSQPYISSGEISSMIWNNKMHSYLYHKLQLRGIDVQSKFIIDTGDKEFFTLLKRFQVKGIEPVKELPDIQSILVLPLNHVIKTLNLFGQPSLELRFKISSEFSKFNPNAVCWQESLNTDPAELKTKKKSDDDRLNQLCLHDLNEMNIGINLRRKQLRERIKHHYNFEVEDELNKLKQLALRVQQKIIEAEKVCEMFSEYD